MYKKWKQIKELRKTNQYQATNFKLQVQKGPAGELYFQMKPDDPSFKLYNGTALPSSEVSRRNNIILIRAFVRLIINGKYVTRSRKALLKWPLLELDISE